MKKFLIALLSLAMLFSFAACDNSNDTPVDPGTEDTPSVYDSVVSTAIQEAGTALASNIATMLPNGDVMAVAKQTASFDDGMALTVTREIQAAGEATPAKSITLTVNGIDTSSATATGTAKASPKTVTLNSFTYVYNSYVLNGGMNVEYTATINGYFTDGPITASVYTDEDGQHYEPAVQVAAANVVLPASSSAISLVIDDQEITGRSLGYAWDRLVENKGTLVSYKGFVEGIETDAVAEFTPYATRILNVASADSTIVSLINNAIAADSNPNSVGLATFTHGYADGTATYTFNVLTNDTVIAKVSTDAADAVRIRGKMNSPITVALSAEEAPAAGSASLPADTFTITGTFVADTYVAGSTNAYVNPVEFTATLVGNFGNNGEATIAVALDGTAANAITLGSVNAFTLDDGSEISATIPMGPEYVAGTDYAKDKTDVVLEGGSVALAYDVDTTAWKATATPAN